MKIHEIIPSPRNNKNCIEPGFIKIGTSGNLFTDTGYEFPKNIIAKLNIPYLKYKGYNNNHYITEKLSSITMNNQFYNSPSPYRLPYKIFEFELHIMILLDDEDYLDEKISCYIDTMTGDYIIDDVKDSKDNDIYINITGDFISDYDTLISSQFYKNYIMTAKQKRDKEIEKKHGHSIQYPVTKILSITRQELKPGEPGYLTISKRKIQHDKN